MQESFVSPDLQDDFLCRPEQSSRIQMLYDKVFRIHHLREHILDFILYDNQTVRLENAFACRMVQKSWFQSVNRCIAMKGNTLLQFDLGHQAGNIDNVIKFGEFVSSYKTVFNWANRVTPFGLNAKFTEREMTKGFDIFNDLVGRCKTGLVELELEFPMESEIVEKSDSNWLCRNSLLSSVKKITILLHRNDAAEDGREILFENPAIQFLKLLLYSCSKVSHFNLSRVSTKEVLPSILNTIILPDTVQTLEIYEELDNDHLDSLVIKNDAIHLTILTLYSTHSIISEAKNGIVYQILHKFRHTLKTFNIGTGDITICSKKTFISFPVMKCLKKLCICDANCIVTNEGKLEQCLPSNQKLKIEPATNSVVQNFTTNSRLGSVKNVNLLLYGGTGDYQTDERVFLNDRIAEGLCCVFPNVTKLTLCATFDDILTPAEFNLRPIFKNMIHLQVLKLQLAGYNNLIDNYALDSILMGLSPEFISILENCRHIWNGLTFEPSVLLSIANLLDLKELSLDIYNLDEFRRIVDRDSVLSDVVFEFALLKMPKLKTLLMNSIQMSPFMVQRWKSECRELLPCALDIELYVNN